MKLITSLNAVSAIRGPQDDLWPQQAPARATVSEALVKTFNFRPAPLVNMMTPPGVAATPAFPNPFDERFVMLTNGELANGSASAPIQQLILYANGLAVVSSDTDTSDVALNEIAKFMDEKFGFRIGSAALKHDHLSNIVVEVSGGFETHMKLIARMAEIISESMPADGKPFHLRRLAFGKDFGVDVPILVGLDAIDRVDFLIERRQNEPFSRNRFYSSAPLPTKAHFAVLERINDMLEAGAY